MIEQVDSAGSSVTGALLFPISDLLKKIFDEVTNPDHPVVNGFTSKKMAAKLLGVDESTGKAK
jgi:spore maturation protein SpmA